MTEPKVGETYPILGGWHVKVRDDGLYCIDVMAMAFNFRVVLAPIYPSEHQTYVKGFCYFGHSGVTMYQARLNAMTAALAWDGYGEPAGYDKRAI